MKRKALTILLAFVMLFAMGSAAFAGDVTNYNELKAALDYAVAHPGETVEINIKGSIELPDKSTTTIPSNVVLSILQGSTLWTNKAHSQNGIINNGVIHIYGVINVSNNVKNNGNGTIWLYETGKVEGNIDSVTNNKSKGCHTVKFFANSGVFSDGSTSLVLNNVPNNSLIKAPSPPPTKEGCKLVGWKDVHDKTWNFQIDRVKSNLNLYAIWDCTNTGGNKCDCDKDCTCDPCECTNGNCGCCKEGDNKCNCDKDCTCDPCNCTNGNCDCCNNGDKKCTCDKDCKCDPCNCTNCNCDCCNNGDKKCTCDKDCKCDPCNCTNCNCDCCNNGDKKCNCDKDCKCDPCECTNGNCGCCKDGDKKCNCDKDCNCDPCECTDCECCKKDDNKCSCGDNCPCLGNCTCKDCECDDCDCNKDCTCDECTCADCDCVNGCDCRKCNCTTCDCADKCTCEDCICEECGCEKGCECGECKCGTCNCSKECTCKKCTCTSKCVCTSDCTCEDCKCGKKDETPGPGPGPTPGPTNNPPSRGIVSYSSGTVNIPDDAPPLVFIADHIKYIYGYPAGDVRPNNNITRAEAAAIFHRLLANADKNGYYDTSYTDVSSDQWFATSIAYLERYGIVNGYPDGTFRPDATITRAEYAAMASRFDKLAETTENAFYDVDSDHWAVSYVNSAFSNGWVEGFGNGNFNPEERITRGQVVTIVNRMLDRGLTIENVPTDVINTYTDLTTSHWAFCAIIEASYFHEYERNKAKQEIWNGYRLTP